MLSYFTVNNVVVILQQLLDILFVWAIVYYGLKIVKNNSRTIQIFKGILLVVFVRALASMLGLTTIANLADSIMTWGVVAIIIIFQPEIRNILEKIGKTSVFSKITSLTVNERESLVDELVKACSEMSQSKTGALISIEQGHSLSDFIKTGTSMNSVVSSELLCSIFQYGTPLHDGAVIIQGVKIACAAAYFPPTTQDLPTSYGARHRAAVGISEITDSITIVVSEETGNISIAQNGELNVYSPTKLREFLMNELGTQINEEEEEKKNSVFSHYFKNKNKKPKEESEDIKKETSDNISIENLAQKDEKLDQFFDSIVDIEKAQDASDDEVEEVNTTQKVDEIKYNTFAQDLLNDVVEPDAIILHYEKDEAKGDGEDGKKE